MQRGTSLAFALLFAAAVAVVVLQTRTPKSHGAPAVSASAEPARSPASEQSPAASAPGVLDLDAGGARPPADGGDEGVDLPPGAPKTVSFGVVLVTYAGVQFAPERARSRDQAKELAGQLLETAKRDFAEAVKKGDRGSTEDAGHIPRGVLEPAIEKALFMLGKGEVHGEALDTPRGYWIVRRNQ